MSALPNWAEKLRRWVPGLWLGLLLAVAAMAAPAAFAALARDVAGLFVRELFAREAATSLVLGVLLLMLERRVAAVRGPSQFSVNMMLLAGAMLCTVVGWYGLQPLMEAARLGQGGALSFGALHGISFALYGVKLALVAALSLRASSG